MKRLYNHKERVNGMITLSPLKKIQRTTPIPCSHGELSEGTEERLSNKKEWLRKRPISVNFLVSGEKVKVADLANMLKIGHRNLINISKVYESFTINKLDIEVVDVKRLMCTYNIEDYTGIIKENITIKEAAEELGITETYAYEIKKKQLLFKEKYKITTGERK